jgi:hypothetical protein
MAAPVPEQRKVAMLSGNVCAFDGCAEQLAIVAADGEVVVLGEIAHIVGESPDGPRGVSPLSKTDRGRVENLMLLCNRHHQLIDDKPDLFTVEKLLQMKADHEVAVQKGVTGRLPSALSEPPLRTDRIYSTMLPVQRMPRIVYGAPCSALIEQAIKPAPAGKVMSPFILKGGMLWAFQDLRRADGPFAALVDIHGVERHECTEWWDDPDRMRWYQQLLNRSLNKLTGRRGLKLDARHHRYYFAQEAPGQPRLQTYRPLNKERATRSVVWQPTARSTGEARNYWLHRAVSLRFDRVDSEAWILSIRPELRVTKDGEADLPSEAIGRKVTRKKSRLFNYDLLGEVQFWRDFLGDSSARILFDFGTRDQRLIIDTSMVAADVAWPGIPDEYAMDFGNVDYVDDLLSWAEAEGGDEDDDEEDFDTGEPAVGASTDTTSALRLA